MHTGQWVVSVWVLTPVVNIVSLLEVVKASEHLRTAGLRVIVMGGVRRIAGGV
jgi:hypothetical protein